MHVKYILDKKIGCLIDYGPPRAPNDRAVVERFFRYIADNFSHRVVGTTGSNVRDPVREALAPSKKSGLSLLMSLDELKHAIDIVLSDHNGKPHSGIFGNTPLALFTSRLSKRLMLVGRLRPEERKEYDFLKRVQVCVVRSSKKITGVYINFANARYRNASVLRVDMLGRKIQIAYDERDISHVRAYAMDGKFIGVLKASHPWGSEKHFLKLRQTLCRAMRERLMNFKEGQSLLEMCNKLREHKGTSRTTTTEHYKLTQSVEPSTRTASTVPSNQSTSLVKEVDAIPLKKFLLYKER